MTDETKAQNETTAGPPPPSPRTSLRPWDPFEMLQQFPSEVSRLWGEMWPILPRPFSRPIGRVAEGTTNWTPRIDAFEKDGNLVVKADLPGVKQEDIKVTIEDNSLVIEGERKTESEVKEENYFRSERVYGHFYRYIPLDFEASPDQVKASFKDGVLEVRVPRPEPRPSSARSIPVSS